MYDRNLNFHQIADKLGYSDNSIPGVFTKITHPGVKQTYDLIMCNHALVNWHSDARKTMRKFAGYLWERSCGYMIFIEGPNVAGFRAVSMMRSFFKDMAKKDPHFDVEFTLPVFC